MGIFASFSKGFNAGKKRAGKEKTGKESSRNDLLNCPVELVEPSVGNVVEFKVTEKNEFYAQTYMRQIITYAKCLERLGEAKWEIKGQNVRIVFQNEENARITRRNWKK